MAQSTVKHWVAAMEANASGTVHVHLMLQDTRAQDCGSNGFIFEGKCPNASTQDYLGEGLCRKKLQQSIDRGMFYAWVDKIGIHRLPDGGLGVSGNYEPCWTKAKLSYQILGKWPEALRKQRKLTSDKYEEYLYLPRDGVLARKRNLDAVCKHEVEVAEAALIEANSKRLRSNPALYQPFPEVPVASAWLATHLS